MSAKITAKAVSQVSEQLPSFISEEYPLFEKFTKNYFEFLETVCVYYGIVTGYETAYTFIVGETVTGSSTGATATVKAMGANSGINKLFLEPTNTLDFEVDEIFVGSTSNSRGSITKVVRNPVNALKTFSELMDPSTTSEGILKSFKNELYPNVRDAASADLRGFIKHLKDFYRSKGSEKSVRTLFRLLYNEENLDLYYPKTDLLKVSDGKWSQNEVLQLINDPEYFKFNGLIITGISSYSTAFVSTIEERKFGAGFIIIELVITNRSGVFTIGETITATTLEGEVVTAVVTSQMIDITITDGGVGYEIDDSLTISDSTNAGFGAAGKVISTTADQLTTITVSNSGNGYQVNDVLVFDNTDTNTNSTAAAKIATIKDTQLVDVVTSTLKEFILTTSFEVLGDSTMLPFGIDVSTGFLIGNASVFGDATQQGEIVSISNSELTIYDHSQAPDRIGLEDDSGYLVIDSTNGSAADADSYILSETDNLTAFTNGDFIWVFDSYGIPIAGAKKVVINDLSFTILTTNVLVNAANYNTDGNVIGEKTGTYSRNLETITVTIPSEHNFPDTGTQYVSINFADDLHETDDDGATFLITYVSATEFTVSSNSGSDPAGGSMSLINNKNNTIKNSLIIEEQTFGSIDTVSITSHGAGYEALPSATVDNVYYRNAYEPDGEGGYYGRNAEFTMGALGGTITGVTISEGGFGYIAEPTVICATNPSNASTAATLAAVMSDTKTRDGVFLDDSGKPSSIKKIQDSDYYQDFSYVIKTSDSIDVWKQDVLKLIHPAGHKLFGEVSLRTLMNATMFDRGNNNINSILTTGLAQYRDLSREFVSEILNNLYITVETSMNKEVQMDLFLDNSVYYGDVTSYDRYLYWEDGGVIIGEDDDKILAEIPREVLNSEFLPDEIIESVIEYVRLILTTSGTPALFNSLMSVKDATAVNFRATKNEQILLETGSNILSETNEIMVSENIEIVTVQTSDPHYFHINDEIYLDEFEGTNVHLLNGRLFRVAGVDIQNSAILIDSTDGSADAGDNLLFETDSIILKEDISIFTLNDPESLTDYGSLDIVDDDVPSSTGVFNVILLEDENKILLETGDNILDENTVSILIDTYGKVFRPGKSAAAGVPISLLGGEYIGEYSGYELDPYIQHESVNFDTLPHNTRYIFRERRISIESNILSEDGDNMLLETGYKILADDGTIDQDSSDMDEILLTESQTKVGLGGYITDEDTIGDDKLILEDGGGIFTEDTGVINGVVTFDQPFDYKAQPYENNNGFLYFKHKVDQKVSV